jgi:hypothetical protein
VALILAGVLIAVSGRRDRAPVPTDTEPAPAPVYELPSSPNRSG